MLPFYEFLARPWVALPVLAFKIWMIIECIRKDPDRYIWFWVIFLIPFGAIIYFFARWLPGANVKAPTAARRFTRGGEIRRLETAAQQIGNAYQYVMLGDALLETGRHAAAGEAYENALRKEPDNLQALWGAGQVSLHSGEAERACERFERVLAIDSSYKFGDVSLAYGKALYALDKVEPAREQFQQHVQRWRHPEALYLLGKICTETDRLVEAREHLQALITDVNGSPQAIARKHRPWKSRAQRLLRRIPAK